MACAAYFNQEADDFILKCTENTDRTKECREALALYVEHWTTHVAETRNGEMCSICSFILQNEPVIPNNKDAVAYKIRLDTTRNHLRIQQVSHRRPHVVSGLLFTWYYFTKLFDIDVHRSVKMFDPVSVTLHFLLGCCKTMMSETGSPVDTCQSAIQNCIEMRRHYPVRRSVHPLTSKPISSSALSDHGYCASKRGRFDDDDNNVNEYEDELSDTSSVNESTDNATNYWRVIKRFVDEISVSCRGAESDTAAIQRPCIMSNVGDVRVSIRAQQQNADARCYISHNWVTERLGVNFVRYMDEDSFSKGQPGLTQVNEIAQRELETVDLVGERREVVKMFGEATDRNSSPSCQATRLEFKEVNEKRPNITSIRAIGKHDRARGLVMQSEKDKITRLLKRNRQKSDDLLRRALFLASVDTMFTSTCAKNNSDMNGMGLLFHNCVWCTLLMLAPMRAICWDLVQMIRIKLSSLGIGVRVPGARSMPSLNDEVLRKRAKKLESQRKSGDFRAGFDGLPVPGSFSLKKSGDKRYVPKSSLPGARSADKRCALGIRKPNKEQMTNIFDEGELNHGADAVETISTGVTAVKDGVMGEHLTYDFVGKVPTLCALKSTFDEWVGCKYPLVQSFICGLPGTVDANNVILSLWEHLSSSGNPLCGANIRRAYTDTDIHQADNQECFLSTAINLMMTCSRLNTHMKQSDFRKLEEVARRHLFSVRFLNSNTLQSVV